MCAEHAYCAELQTQDTADVSFMRWINPGWGNTIKLLIYTRLYKGLVGCAAALFGTALSVRANHVTKRTVTLVLTVGISDVAELNDFFLFTGATTHCGFEFCSPLAGYSLLAYEIS